VAGRDDPQAQDRLVPALVNDALALLRAGGLYVIDDLSPHPNWPDDHAPKVPRLIEDLERHPRLKVSKLLWSSGIIVATRVGD
jgi:predicted O-methyltransferase YrrM